MPGANVEDSILWPLRTIFTPLHAVLIKVCPFSLGTHSEANTDRAIVSLGANARKVGSAHAAFLFLSRHAVFFTQALIVSVGVTATS